MSNSSVFSFSEKIDDRSYNLYIFKDFTGSDQDAQDDIFGVIDIKRQKTHSPNTVFIICKSQTILDRVKIEGRFVNGQEIKYINYKDVDANIFESGILEITTKNRVVQYAPYGTIFKKTSGDESNYFIKASLSLLEYSEICFMALAIYHKIDREELSFLKKIYVDTSSIISLVQSLIYCYNMLEDSNINPQIINFRSYREQDIDFNINYSFTVISASSSDNLRAKNNISSDKCLTLFYPKNKEPRTESLFLVDIKNTDNSTNPKTIPLTSEDFSLEYSKSKEIIITKSEVERLDSKQLIKKILDNEFKKISYSFSHDDIKNQDCIEFNSSSLYKLLENNGFIEDTLLRSFALEKDNYIIYDFENPKENCSGIKKDDFIKPESNIEIINIKDKNVIVFLTQSTESDLILISQKLRQYCPANINYIIGLLITDSSQHSKNLKNNICFNDTPYKYGFYCYLDLPLLGIKKPENIKKHKLTDGFVFYDGNNSKDLNPYQVYLVVCFILQLLRDNKKLTDNISYHDVLSPKTFSRFNDSLLQLSLLTATMGRELNFCSNTDLSMEMKNVILDLLISEKKIGKEFAEALKRDQIKLTNEDFEEIKNKHPEIFSDKDTIWL